MSKSGEAAIFVHNSDRKCELCGEEVPRLGEHFKGIVNCKYADRRGPACLHIVCEACIFRVGISKMRESFHG